MISIESIANKAISEVKSLPVEYRLKAFEIVFQYFLQNNILEKSNKPKKSESRKSSTNILEQILASDYDWSSTNLQRMPPLAQYLIVLQISQDHFDAPGLSSSDVRRILLEKFRINKTIHAVSMALLDSLGNKVDRTNKGKTYVYRISSLGRKYLDDVHNQIGGN